MDADKVRQLIGKLETQNDITIEEADQIYALSDSVIDAINNTIHNKPTINEQGMEEILSKDFPIAELKKWYEAVAKKIRAGYSGNFIFSLFLGYGTSFFYKYIHPALDALEEAGSFEDRVNTVCVNEKVYSLLPKYVQDLFKWKRYELLLTYDDRAGFYRYPMQRPGNDETYTISQVFEKLSLIPVMTISDINKLKLSTNDATKYILSYLKQKIPYVEMDVIKPFECETIVFTNNEGIAIAKEAINISLNELVKNALAQGFINEETAKELLNGNGEIGFNEEGNFDYANLRYIDEVVKRKMKWRHIRKEVESETDWLEVLR